MNLVRPRGGHQCGHTCGQQTHVALGLCGRAGTFRPVSSCARHSHIYSPQNLSHVTRVPAQPALAHWRGLRPHSRAGMPAHARVLFFILREKEKGMA